MVARRVFTCLSNKELSNVQESVVIFFSRLECIRREQRRGLMAGWRGYMQRAGRDGKLEFHAYNTGWSWRVCLQKQ